MQEANLISAAADRIVDITACLSVVYEKTSALQATTAQTDLAAAPAVPTPLLKLVQEAAGTLTTERPKKTSKTSNG